MKRIFSFSAMVTMLAVASSAADARGLGAPGGGGASSFHSFGESGHSFGESGHSFGETGHSFGGAGHSFGEHGPASSSPGTSGGSTGRLVTSPSNGAPGTSGKPPIVNLTQ
jgi:hypothetical protein